MSGRRPSSRRYHFYIKPFLSWRNKWQKVGTLHPTYSGNELTSAIAKDARLPPWTIACSKNDDHPDSRLSLPPPFPSATTSPVDAKTNSMKSPHRKPIQNLERTANETHKQRAASQTAPAQPEAERKQVTSAGTPRSVPTLCTHLRRRMLR